MRKSLAAIASVVLAVPGLTAIGVATTAERAQAAPGTTITLIGHGNGHGRGMGQYGAYGYALEHFSAAWILDHYYGGTHAAAVDPAQAINVHLTGLDGYGGIGVRGAGLSVNGQPVAGGITIVNHGRGDQTVAASGDVQVNFPGNSWRSYKGQIIIKGSAIPGLQTWNHVGLDQYVGGVVPAESPASWGVAGPAALQAQAVAARSYGLASVLANGVTCDTTSCQVYDGDQDAPGTLTNGPYTPYSDRAVAATAGVVREWPSGAVARTEFASSTGGLTAGGAFPAVVDDGDAVPGTRNPHHTWTAQIATSSIEAAFRSIGLLQAVNVTARTGQGDLGGRVTRVVIVGTGGHVTLTGEQFAASFGLRSDWFAVADTGPSGGTDGYWLLGGDGRVFTFGQAGFFGSTAGVRLNRPVVAMAPTPSQQGYWLVAADGGISTFGNARFYGSTGGMRLSQPVVGMAPTPSGNGYWLVTADGGVFTFGDARFFGSTGKIRLRQPVVCMVATRDGGGYWLVAADGGVFTFGDASYYGSTGSARLNQPIVGAMASPDRRGYSLVGRDGGIFTFGDARYVGSLPGWGVTGTVVSVSSTADGGGYLELSAGGRVYSFGDAPYDGDPQTNVAGWTGSAIGLSARSGP